jgi:hypothetical protein
VCAIADEVNEGRYPEPEFGADYCEQEPEIPNAELRWVMALIGFAPTLRCSCGGTLLVGKDVQPLQCQTYSNSRVYGIGRVMVWSQKLVFGLGCFLV